MGDQALTVPDVLVIGAGIVGAACAWQLAKEGLSVTVVDRFGPGSGTTAAGMGHITVMDDSEAQFALTRYSRDLWEDVADELPVSVEFDRAGTLWIASDDEELEHARKKARIYGDRGVATDLIDAQELRGSEPALRHDLLGALLVRGDCVLYPPAAAAWLLGRAVERGARFDSGVAVTRVDGRGVWLTDGTRRSAGVVVNAAGHRALDLMEHGVTGISLRPRKGHLVITERCPGMCRHQIVELGYLKSAHGREGTSVAFNVQPRRTGQVLVGSSRQFGVTTADVESPILERMVQRALRFLPPLAEVRAVRAWTGFRAATDDHLPLIGWVPDVEGVILATGHEGLGITTSLGTACLVADLLLGRTSEIPREPYAIGR